MLSVLANIPTNWNIKTLHSMRWGTRSNNALAYAPLYLCLWLYCLCGNCLDVTYLFPWTHSSYPIFYHTFTITKQLFSIFVASNPQPLSEADFVLFPFIRFKMMANSMSQTFVSCLFVYLSRDRRILLRMNSGDVSIKEQDTVLYIPTEGFVKATRSKSEKLGT